LELLGRELAGEVAGLEDAAFGYDGGDVGNRCATAIAGL